MPATMLAEFSTTYQRAVLSTLNDTSARWFNSFDLSTLTRYNLFGPVVGQFQIVFSGSGLENTPTGITGSVTGVEIYLITGSFPRPLVAEVTGLNIPDFGAFVTNALTLPNTEPDFTDADVAEFFAAITSTVINGSPGDDVIEAGPGPTDIYAGKGNDVVLAGPGGGLIKMGSGSRDAVDFRNVSSGIDADLGTGTISSGGTVWNVSGVNFLFGSNLADTLTGSGGDDDIFGRAGDDRILGLGGKDILKGDDGNDRIFGGAGNDKLFGQKGNDVLRGGGENDKLFGQVGRDKLFGGSGNDTLYGGTGRDKLVGGKGIDVLVGGDGDDVLLGGRHRDLLFGASGNDTLNGGSGNDNISGGTGDDVMSGGSGSDVFIFSGSSLGVDTISDFEQGLDNINFEYQTASNISISPVGGTTNIYEVTHLEGTIFVTMVGGSGALLLDDLSFG